MTKDLTKGSPMKLILGFGVPLLFGLLFQQFYNMVDTIIVGRMLGVDALAAVGSTGSINFMILGFCIGLCNGFAIPIAQKFGAKDDHGLRNLCSSDNCSSRFPLQEYFDLDAHASKYHGGCLFLHIYHIYGNSGNNFI